MNLRILVFIFLVPMYAIAADPEIILPKTKVLHSPGWYAEQVPMWQKKVDLNKSDANAWLNYYTASRYAQVSDVVLSAIVNDMTMLHEGTFEYLVVRALHEGYNAAGFSAITKAYNLRPGDPSTYQSLLIFGELHGDMKVRKEFGSKLYLSNQISSSLLHYSYNVLMSVERNAVLITEGDNTSIPLYVLQDIFKIRDDVKVLQLELLCDASYRTQVFQQLSLSFDETRLTTDDTREREVISKLLSSQNPTTKFYFTLTLSPDNLTAIKEQLYVVGLASQVSKERLNNIPLIRENLENNFLLDYLTVDFNGENEFASGRVLSANYLVPMLMLHEHYLDVNDIQSANRLRTLITRLARETGKEKLVSNFLNHDLSDIPYFSYTMDLKKTEGIFRKIKDNIYAQEYEVTNGQYNQFLNYLRDHKLEEQLSKYAVDISKYEEPALSFVKNYSADRKPTKKEKYFSNYPVVSISYESALAYCDWMTEQYNHQEGRKFKKVRFRLPSISEWQIAALGYDKFQSWNLDENTVMVGVFNDSKSELSKELRPVEVKGNDIWYPWYKAYNYRNKVLNSRGCALGNFKFPEPATGCGDRKIIGVDGFVMMAPVQSYFPNDMGLYDVVGNVAEMTSEKGKACGGSWNHKPEESTIRSINEFSGADIAVGFRLFMEIIEP
jgi:formylglycine-generating enzyme required for sulfatase activity